LREELLQEHLAVRRFYSAHRPILLSQAVLYLPFIGWASYIQSLRIAVFHDDHHLSEVRATLADARTIS
jgi:hypothetical protein